MLTPKWKISLLSHIFLSRWELKYVRSCVILLKLGATLLGMRGTPSNVSWKWDFFLRSPSKCYVISFEVEIFSRTCCYLVFSVGMWRDQAPVICNKKNSYPFNRNDFAGHGSTLLNLEGRGSRRQLCATGGLNASRDVSDTKFGWFGNEFFK